MSEFPYHQTQVFHASVSTRHRATRQPIYPTTIQKMEIHPDIKKLPRLRQRGLGQYIPSQCYLEIERQEGLRDLEMGIFYCYLEEEYDDGDGSIIVARFGNVFGGDHWTYRIAVFPKHHPDGEQVPFKMENVS